MTNSPKPSPADPRHFARGNGLTFPWPEVLKAVNEVRGAREVRTLYGDETGPGLWLVGDHGVYLMPNTTAKTRTIVYAHRCDPTKFPFDTWWAKKQATFGADDGVEFIALSDIETLLGRFRQQYGPPQIFHVAMNENEFLMGFVNKLSLKSQ